ncbi:uncharacterized protein HMPREF1541_06732 [Cyphellophora europaea CBS 101466]|uniref:NAD(P)-binding protein n=1 Tax=Cyphellophora europaea (strain CBS 101466) TaxID=1220924 RepID=W2RQU3_CYPE1|nr:uncharacterized protein HMPREF1541_06732 [Cyphellophora europaea CBS 101466]ETN38695.1 hypothetical protein HMPREF1541_06732 [Cyphellophora europaea CBS 101466]
MPPLTVLVIGRGANRGIGFELARKLTVNGHQVFGTYRPVTRDDPTVQQLKAYKIPTFEVDLTDEDSIMRLAEDYATHPRGGALDVLINCAGIYFPLSDRPFQAFTADDLLEHFKVNTIGPFLTSKHLTRSLRGSPWGGRILNISSDAASIADNTGGNLPYRLSKTALNQLTATIAAEGTRPSLFEDGYSSLEAAVGGVVGAGNIANGGGGAGALTAISVHPGHTGFWKRDDLERCVDGVAALVERLCDGDDGRKGGRGRELEAGAFYRWDGKKLSW